MKRILSLGAGVNSTAIIALKSQGRLDFDLAVFADTGSEMPETYVYLNEVLEPFCSKNNIPLEVVKKDGVSMHETYMSKKVIPTRRYGICRDHYKIRVVRKFLKQKFPGEKVETIIGFDAGELNRQKGFELLGEKALFPLIDLGINREGCKSTIRKSGLPVACEKWLFYVSTSTNV